jgi:GNAT superfamily N-acetyltransferase
MERTAELSQLPAPAPDITSLEGPQPVSPRRRGERIHGGMCGLSLSGSSRLLHTVGMIRLGTSADLAAATSVYRHASLSNAGDRDNLLAHPEYLILGPEGLAEGRTHVAEEDGSLVGFATWIETAGTIELEDLFVDPGYMRRGIAAALVNRIVDVLRARGVERL